MNIFDKIIKTLLILTLFSLIIVVSIQVFARFLLPQAPSWTEELARILLLYMVGLASGIAYRKGMFINIDILQNLVKKSKILSFTINLIAHLITTITMVFLTINSIPMLKLGITQTTSVLLIPTIFIFLTITLIPINILTAQFYLVFCYFRKIKKL